MKCEPFGNCNLFPLLSAMPLGAIACVVLLTEPGTRLPDGEGVRLLIGFPDANSGAVAYFNATQVPAAATAQARA